MNKWLLLAAAIVSEVAASLSLKAALSAPWFYVVVVLGYVSAFALLAAALRRGMALGVGYGIWGASGVAATAGMSTVLFGEPLTGLMGAGIALVVVGVLCVELGSQSAQARIAIAADQAREGR